MTHIHILKTDWKFYDHVNMECKTAEIRKHDRNYQVGDYLLLVRTGMPPSHISRIFEISHICTHIDYPDGLKEGYSMLSIKPVPNDVAVLVYRAAVDGISIDDEAKEVKP